MVTLQESPQPKCESKEHVYEGVECVHEVCASKVSLQLDHFNFLPSLLQSETISIADLKGVRKESNS